MPTVITKSKKRRKRNDIRRIYKRPQICISFRLPSLEHAKPFCYGDDRVLCTEKYATTGVEVHLVFGQEWRFRLRPSCKYIDLGFVSISWNWTKHKVADRVVTTEMN